MTLPETLRAAFVIARRDFTATVFSKTFLLFLHRAAVPGHHGGDVRRDRRSHRFGARRRRRSR